MGVTLHEARERLRRSVEEYIALETELRAMENTEFRVCVFGSARIQPADPVYQTVFTLAQGLAERGIDVVTGGGPGLMEAANRGAYAAQRRLGKSYGLPIELPSISETPNPHLDFQSAHKRFSSRLDEFIRLSHGIVVAPGGIGTLLELTYVWQLLQLEAMEERPVVLLGREFWHGLLAWMRDVQLGQKLLNEEDLLAVHVVDTPEEVLAVIEPAHEQFLLRRKLTEQTLHEVENRIHIAQTLTNLVPSLAAAA